MADPYLGTAQSTGTTAQGGSIGDCISDQFSIDGPNQGSPVICGTNTGQHSKFYTVAFQVPLQTYLSFVFGINPSF